MRGQRARVALGALALFGCRSTVSPSASSPPHLPRYVAVPAPPPTERGTPQGSASNRRAIFLSSVPIEVPPSVYARIDAPEETLGSRLALEFSLSSEPTGELIRRYPKTKRLRSGFYGVAPFVQAELETKPDDFLHPTFVVDYDEEPLVALTQTMKREEQSPKHLERFVHQYIKTKTYSRSFDIASRVAVEQKGDCTEHAVLLAALLRATGTPAVIVFGVLIVVSPDGNAFAGGHAWVEAWSDSHWQRLDSAFYLADEKNASSIGIADLDPIPPRNLKRLYFATETLKDESPAFSRTLSKRALTNLVNEIRLRAFEP